MDSKMDPSEAFRFGLEGVVEIAERLKPFCNTVEELVDMCKLALTNEGQFRLLVKTTTARK